MYLLNLYFVIKSFKFKPCFYMKLGKIFASILILALMLSAQPGQFSASAAPSTTLVINEIDYDQPGTDTTEFVEIKNVSSETINLSEYSLEFINGTGGGASVYASMTFGNRNIAAGEYFVICQNFVPGYNCHYRCS